MDGHILIVDADARAAAATCALVQRVAPAATLACEHMPYGGWLHAQQMMPDVLIIDPSTQGPAGMLVIHLCKEHNPNLRVIVLAAAPTPTLRRQLQHMGITTYGEKPAASEFLVGQLRADLHESGTVPVGATQPVVYAA